MNHVGSRQHDLTGQADCPLLRSAGARYYL